MLHEEAHQTTDLFLGAPPVLSGESEKRQMTDAELPTLLNHHSYCFGSVSVALDSRHEPLFSPTAVTVHDDGEVAWDNLRGRCRFPLRI
jgi:hypothetical protein